MVIEDIQVAADVSTNRLVSTVCHISTYAALHSAKVMKQNSFDTFDELKATFANADKVGKLTVFNIGGNKVRLIAAIHYNTHKVYIRDVLTHQEYDLKK